MILTYYLTALFLGLIEGLTEFLPVSSTAHLLILTKALNFQGPDGHVFEIFIQLGAIFAVVVLYFKKLLHTTLTLHSSAQSRNFALCLIVGTIPALIAGYLLRDVIKTHVYDNPFVIPAALIIGGIIMLVLDKRFSARPVESLDHIPVKTAFLVGCAQALALIPGVSRSGASIMGGLALGLPRGMAAEFSFFMALPVMVAAVTYDTYKSWDAIASGGYWGLMMTGFAAAFVAALLVMKIAVGFVTRYGFTPFAWYRIVLGAGLLLLAL